MQTDDQAWLCRSVSYSGDESRLAARCAALVALLFGGCGVLAADLLDAADSRHVAGPVIYTPAEAGAFLTDNLLARDFMFYGEDGLHYAEAATAVGALRFAERTASTEAVRRLRERYAPLAVPGSGLVGQRPHVDFAVIGIVPLEIARQAGDAEARRFGLAFADDQWHDTLPNGLTAQTRWWIDDLYMVGMLQIQAYRVTGDRVYADRAARQLAAYLPTLQHENGLFYHSPDVPVFWGRGNGWVAAALAEVLVSLPADHPDRTVLLDGYLRMMAALLAYQADNGMWRQIVDYPYAWTESSATGMFAFAMAAGVNAGLLDADTYAPVVIAAWRALAAHIDSAGNVREICVGTGKKNDFEYYLKRPRVDGDLHGQAPVLWLAAELLDDRWRRVAP